MASASKGKEYSLAVKIAGSVSSSFNSAMGSAEKKISGLGTIAKQAAAIASAAWGAVKIGQFVSDAVDTYTEFEQAMANTAAIAGATEEQYDQLRTAALEMGKATSKTAAESADALGYMALAGWDVQDAISSLEPILRLSEATQMDLARCSDLVTDSMSALGLEVSDLSTYLDVAAQANNKSNQTAEMLMEAYIGVGGTLKNLRVPIQESAAALGVMANRGIKGSEAGNALNAVLANLTTGTGRAGKMMEKLGISAFDSSGNFIGLQETIMSVYEATKDMTEAERNAALAAIGGKEHTDALNALMSGLTTTTAEGTSEWNSLADALYNSQGAMANMAATVTDTWEGANARLNSAIDDLKINIVSTFAPYATDAINSVAAAIPNITAAVLPAAQAFMDTAIPKVTGFISMIRNKALEIFEAIRPKLESIGAKATEVFSTLAGYLGSAFEAVQPALSWIIDIAIPTAVGVVLDLVDAFGSAVLVALDFKEVLVAAAAVYGAFKAGKALQGMIQGFQQAKVTLALFKATTQGANIAQAAFNGTLTIGETLTALFTGQVTLAQLAQAAWATVTGAVTKAFGALNAVLMANPIVLIVTAIVAVIAILVVLYNKCEWFRDLVDTVVGAIVGFIKNAVSAIAGFFKNLWATIQSIWSAVSGWFKSKVIDPLVNFFRPIVQWISGFFQGCWIIIQAVWKAVSGWFKTNVIDPVVNFFAPIPGIIGGFFFGLWEGIKAIWATVSGWFIINVIQPLVNFFAPIVESIGGFFSGLWESIKGIWQAAGTWFSENVTTPINNAFQAVGDFVKGVFNGLIGMVEGMINRIIGAVNKFIGGFNDVVGWGASFIGVDWGGVAEIPEVSLPRLAEGGIVDSPTILEAGEAGTEAIVPLSELWGKMQDMISGPIGYVADRVSALADRMEAMDIGSTAIPISELLAKLQETGHGGGPDLDGPGGGGPVYHITYAPQYSFAGGAPSKEDMTDAEHMSQEEFERRMDRWMKDNARKRF